MVRIYRGCVWGLAAIAIMALGGSRSLAQGPTIDAPDLPSPGSGGSLLGQSPGSGGGRLGTSPGTSDSILGGRPGATTPRNVPTSISTPGVAPGGNPTILQRITPTPDLLPTPLPAAGPLAIPVGEEDPGPADGLTLDMAIDRLVREGLDLRGKFLEIPQAQADILTASLRANPIFYADSQLIPYGSYTAKRPGGQTQYDVNISYPLDLSGKRKARINSAGRAKKVLEAQYQDAVRLSIDNVYSAYVDVLQARRVIVFAEAGLKGLEGALRSTTDLKNRGEKKEADVRRIKIQRDLAAQQVLEGQEAYRKSQATLATLLNFPPDQTESLVLSGTIRMPGVTPPPLETLIQIALSCRPDLVAYRLGVERARSDVKLQMANRFSDVYVLYQPYTFQDNTPQGLKSPTSWALGVTVPLPVYNRNQGNIQRAKINVEQTQVELASIERLAINEVQVAEREYHLARAAIDRLERDVLPDSKVLLDEAERLYPSEYSVTDYLGAQREYNDNARLYLDGLVRLRRSLLELNTAVGQRIVP